MFKTCSGLYRNYSEEERDSKNKGGRGRVFKVLAKKLPCTLVIMSPHYESWVMLKYDSPNPSVDTELPVIQWKVSLSQNEK